MGRPMNNDSAKKWWECGRHVRQKEPAPSAEVRRTRPEVVRAPPDASSYVAGVARARGRARLLRAAEQASCRIRRRRGGSREAAGKAALLRAKESLSTGWAARLCCEQRGRVAAAWPCRLHVACASEFKPLIWPESARQREPRERGQGFRVPVCACAVIDIVGVHARVLGPTQLS